MRGLSLKKYLCKVAMSCKKITFFFKKNLKIFLDLVLLIHFKVFKIFGR